MGTMQTERGCQTLLTSRSEPSLRHRGHPKLPPIGGVQKSSSGRPPLYARDARTKDKVLPKLLAKLVGHLAEEAPVQSRSRPSSTERRGCPGSSPRRPTRAERRATTVIISSGQGAAKLALTTVCLEKPPPPQSPEKPHPSSAPARVVSMERLIALAQPKRRKTKHEEELAAETGPQMLGRPAPKAAPRSGKEERPASRSNRPGPAGAPTPVPKPQAATVQQAQAPAGGQPGKESRKGASHPSAPNVRAQANHKDRASPAPGPGKATQAPAPKPKASSGARNGSREKATAPHSASPPTGSADPPSAPSARSAPSADIKPAEPQQPTPSSNLPAEPQQETPSPKLPESPARVGLGTSIQSSNSETDDRPASPFQAEGEDELEASYTHEFEFDEEERSSADGPDVEADAASDVMSANQEENSPDP
ncbi:unnamed protein product [Symbiodinium natans]|uniref:Uncharacterized protein n=1 Tax=Symbiodinium natans TaxID=878477 RepID=A0A812MN99_9DINO|nr:unnamed protein product [Symbiodinium natans]